MTQLTTIRGVVPSCNVFLSFEERVIVSLVRRVERLRSILAAELKSEVSDEERELLYSLLLACRACEHYLALLVNVKQDQGFTAWCHLVDADRRARHAGSFFVTEQIKASLQELIERLNAMTSTVFPHLVFSSVSYEAEDKLCSVCGSSLVVCEHIPGKLYGLTLCRPVPVGPTLRETSLVLVPRDRKAAWQVYTLNGKQFDVFRGTKTPAVRADVNDSEDADALRFSGYAMTFSESDLPEDWKSLLESS